MKEIQLFPELIVAKLDHNVLLSTALATVVIPIAHTLLHRFVITVCPPPINRFAPSVFNLTEPLCQNVSVNPYPCGIGKGKPLGEGAKLSQFWSFGFTLAGTAYCM